MDPITRRARCQTGALRPVPLRDAGRRKNPSNGCEKAFRKFSGGLPCLESLRRVSMPLGFGLGLVIATVADNSYRRRRDKKLFASKMKCLLIAVLAHIALAAYVVAGRPIILDEVEACSETDLVVVATISATKDVPADDPFGGSSWHNFGFTKFAQAKVEQTLFGTAPDELSIYGGKMPTGTDFRIEEGRYLVLLTKVKDDAYRAVDWHYSFAPLKDGKVGWLIERFPAKREWISPVELLRRIKANKSKSEQAGAGQPATRSESKSKGGDKPQPESEGRSR